MSELNQHRNFRRLYFSTTEEGILIRESAFLRFKTKERFVSYFDLGINTVKESTNEGIPTILIIGFMMAVQIYLIFYNLGRKPVLSLIFTVFLIIFAMVIIFTIQNYIKSSYRITGGQQEIELLRYPQSEAETVKFIEYLKQQTKRAQILKYNNLVQHFRNNERVKFPLLDPNVNISDTELKLLQYKTELLYGNLLIEKDESEFLNEES